MKDTLKRRALSITSIMSMLLLAASVTAQKAELVLHSPQTPPKQDPAKTQSKKAASEQRRGKADASGAAVRMTTQKSSEIQSKSSDQPVTAQSGCDVTILLLMDSVTQLSIHTFAGSPANTTITFTVSQDNSGTVGFSLTQGGPFTGTITVDVTTDSNGVGTSAPFYTMGLILGETNATASSVELGTTNLVHLTVIKQCNCPPISVVP